MTALGIAAGVFLVFLWLRYELRHPQEEMNSPLYVPRDGEWPVAVEDVSYVRHGGLDP